MTDSTVVKYGVGRGRKIVGSLTTDLEHAQRELEWYEAQMKSVGLTPDVKIMYVEETTTTTAPKVWKEPDPEPDPTPDPEGDPVTPPVEDAASATA